MKARSIMIKIAIITAVLIASVAAAQAQTVNFYDARGNRTGSATTTGSGTTNYYDARGNRTGSATQSGAGTSFYDARGNRVGSAFRQ